MHRLGFYRLTKDYYGLDFSILEDTIIRIVWIDEINERVRVKYNSEDECWATYDFLKSCTQKIGPLASIAAMRGQLYEGFKI